MNKIVFICTGNTCRSPMAEAILRSRLPDALKDKFEISSAGVFAWDGEPASSQAIKVLEEIGIDLSGHRARRMTEEITRDAALVVAMTEAHRLQVLADSPSAESKVILLGSLDGSRNDADIADPIGGSKDVFTAARDEIAELVDRLIDYLFERFEIER